MPAHTIPSAIKCWIFPTWQAASSVEHDLFFEDSKHLPEGWTLDDARSFKAYFNQFLAKPAEDGRTA